MNQRIFPSNTNQRHLLREFLFFYHQVKINRNCFSLVHATNLSFYLNPFILYSLRSSISAIISAIVQRSSIICMFNWRTKIDIRNDDNPLLSIDFETSLSKHSHSLSNNLCTGSTSLILLIIPLSISFQSLHLRSSPISIMKII